MGWHDERFAEMPGKLRLDCAVCARPMWFPPSKHGKYLCCGPICTRARLAAIRKERERPCETCGKVFVPRPGQLAVGHGTFCSQKCNTKSHLAMNRKDAQARARATWKARNAEQPFAKSGPENPRWKGGKEASNRRRIESGKRAEETRRYRMENPHKVREFTVRRWGRKFGRLPRGTIPRLGGYQRWKCAICRTGIKRKYHVDHIVPLALGGEHKPENIQLLCPTCNVRKSAKHPVDYMQERGFLL